MEEEMAEELAHDIEGIIDIEEQQTARVRMVLGRDLYPLMNLMYV